MLSSGGIDLNEGAGFLWNAVDGGTGGSAKLYLTLSSYTGTRAMSLWVNNVRVATLSTNSTTSPRPAGSEFAPITVNLVAGKNNNIEIRDTEGTLELDAIRLRVGG